MNLSSVRALKEELLAVPEPLVEGVATAKSFSAFATPRAKAERAMKGIALGVVPEGKKSQFKLAVRLQRSGPLITAMTQEIEQRAKGEVDVQYIGNLVKFAGVTQAAYYRARRRPLRIGSSISDVHADFHSAGTLGCFVIGRKSPY